MSLLYHAYVYLEFLILACTIYILAPFSLFGTEEDRHYGIDRWAKLFKTKTWEDLRMITKNNETMQKAAAPLYQLNSDAVARQCAQSRADAAPCHHLRRFLFFLIQFVM